MDLTVRRGPAADIGEVDRDRLGELHVDLLPALLHRGNALVAPAWRVTQNPRRKLLDIVHAHAARALETHRFAEQALERCIVHVNRVLIGEVDLHEAEGVLPPGKLAEIVIVDFGAVPIDLPRVERIAGRIEGLHAIGGQHVLTSAGERTALRDEILMDDAARHVPIRIEIDLHDLAGNLWRRTLGLADDSRVPRDHLAAFDRLNLRGGDVDHDVTAGGAGR